MIKVLFSPLEKWCNINQNIASLEDTLFRPV